MSKIIEFIALVVGVSLITWRRAAMLAKAKAKKK